MTTGPRTSRIALVVAAVAIVLLAYAVGRHRPSASPRPPEPGASPAPRVVVPAIQASPRASTAAAHARNGDDLAREQAPAPPARQMSHREARELVQRVVERRLGRTLAAADYDRLADVVIQLRTASRALQHPEDAPAGSAEQERLRAVVLQALNDIATITGLPPGELSDALTSQ